MKLKHILFIDPLEKLDLKKDSTLLLAHTMKKKGIEVYLLFEKDFFILSHSAPELDVYHFNSTLVKNDFYVENFDLLEKCKLKLNEDCVFHMRLDPPFDERYLKYLWMIDSLEQYGVKSMNRARGILNFNEKISPFFLGCPIDSYVGGSLNGFLKYIDKLLSEGIKEIILKPVDLYQGIGVEKISLNDLSKAQERFLNKTKEYRGSLMVQPFIKEVESGEIRTVLFGEKVIGTIKKTPKKGEFLANVAQGATFEVIELDSKLERICMEYAKVLSKEGVYWLAFDILGGQIGEVNVTCPGLVVEVSHAEKRNLSEDIIKGLEKLALL